MIEWIHWLPVMTAGTMAGASCGLLGVHIVGMRIPFLAVFVSHAALAGAVFGSLAGVPAQYLHAPALAAALTAALLLGLLDAQGVRVDTNVLIAALFALSMGLAFLGIGLFAALGRPDQDVRSLLWGNLLFCRWRDIGPMLGVLTLQIGFVAACGGHLRALLIGRATAAAMGIPATAVWVSLLVLTSIVLSLHFQTVGGLLIYSLLTNPAAAAYLLVRRHGHVLLLSTLLGAGSGLGGFMLAATSDLPVGAVIVIVSSLVLLAAAVVTSRTGR